MIPKDKIEPLMEAMDVMENKRNRLQASITAISEHQAATKGLYRSYYQAAEDLNDVSSSYKDDEIMWGLLKHFLNVDDSAIKYKYDPTSEKNKKRKA